MPESGQPTPQDDEEEIRKAWEARLANKARSSVTVIDGNTGRKIPNGASPASSLYKGMNKHHTDAGSNIRASW